MNWIRHFFKNYNNLGSELFFLIILVVLTTIINFSTIYIANKNLGVVLNQDINIKITLYEMEINLLSASELEKSFLLFWQAEGIEKSSEKYALPATEEMNNIVSKIETLQQSNLYLSTEINDNFSTIVTQINQYNNEIAQLQQLFHARGYINTGYEGEMRDAAHDLEEKFLTTEGLQNSDLISLFLQIRRREKDYIARQEIEYVNQLYENIDLFKIALSKQNLDRHIEFEILNLLDNYQTGFDGILDTDTNIKKVENSLNKNRSEITTQLLSVSDTIQLSVDAHVNQINIQSQTMLRYLSLTAITILIMSGIILYLLGRIDE